MKKGISFLLIICVLFASLSLLTGCSDSGDSVVIYSSAEEYRNEEMTKQLKEKFPDIDIKVQYLATGNNAAKILEEKGSTEADIVLGLETASYEKISEYMAPLEGFTQNSYLPGFESKDNRGIYWELSQGAIIVNTTELAKLGLPEPKSYADLTNSIYKDLIVMPNPKSSNTGYMFLNMWVNSLGEDAAFAYADELQKNIKQFTTSGSGPVNMLNQGEAVIGLGMVFQAAEQIDSGSPIKIILPEEGCPYNTTKTGIVKGKETKENVRKVFEFINTDFFIYDKEHFVPGALVKNQKNYIENYPDITNSGDMSTISDDKFKDELLKKWKY